MANKVQLAHPQPRDVLDQRQGAGRGYERQGGILEKIHTDKRPQTVCVRYVRKKSRDLDALGFREVMVVMR